MYMILSWLTTFCLFCAIALSKFYHESYGIATLTIDSLKQLTTSIRDDTNDGEEMILIHFYSAKSIRCQEFRSYYLTFSQNLQSENDLTKIKLFAFDMNELSLSSSDFEFILSNYNISINKLPSFYLYFSSNSNIASVFDHDVDDITDYTLFEWIKTQTLKIENNNKMKFQYNKQSHYCINSEQGPNLIIDSQGWICNITSINFETNCCNNGEIIIDEYHDTCNNKKYCQNDYPCCNSYEYCIGCCLNQVLLFFFFVSAFCII